MLSSEPLQQLQQLHDIVSAPAASWWPLAWGWWLLILLLAAGLIWLAMACYQRWRQRHWQRLGLRLLRLPAADLRTINEILKRVSREYYGASTVAALHGADWATFLLQQLPAKQQQQWQQPIAALIAQLYRNQPEPAQVQQYQHFAQLWLRHALPPKRGGANV